MAGDKRPEQGSNHDSPGRSTSSRTESRDSTRRRPSHIISVHEAEAAAAELQAGLEQEEQRRPHIEDDGPDKGREQGSNHDKPGRSISSRTESRDSTRRRPSHIISVHESEAAAAELQAGLEQEERRRPHIEDDGRPLPGQMQVEPDVEPQSNVHFEFSSLRQRPESPLQRGPGSPPQRGPGSPVPRTKATPPSPQISAQKTRMTEQWSSFNNRASSHISSDNFASFGKRTMREQPNFEESLGRRGFAGKLSEYTASHQGLHDPTTSRIQTAQPAARPKSGRFAKGSASVTDVTFAKYDVYNQGMTRKSSDTEKDVLHQQRARRWKHTLNAVVRFNRIRRDAARSNKIMDRNDGDENGETNGFLPPLAETSSSRDLEENASDSERGFTFDLNNLKSSTLDSNTAAADAPADIDSSVRYIPPMTKKQLTSINTRRRASVLSGEFRQNSVGGGVMASISNLSSSMSELSPLPEAGEVGSRPAPKLVKAFGSDSKELLDRLTRKENRGGPMPTTKALKVLLASDKPMDELVDLVYDKGRLTREAKALLKRDAREEKLALKIEEYNMTEEKVKKKRQSMVKQRQRHEEDKAQREVLGWALEKEEFKEALRQHPVAAQNQIVVARLMQTLMEVNEEREAAPSMLHFLNCYRCLDPDHWFINLWTVLYVLLILYIATAGLFNVCFPLDADSFLAEAHAAPDCGTDFSPQQWFDASVDFFFVIDIFFRLLLFGFVVEGSDNGGATVEKVQDPDKVCLHYMRNALLIDLVTAVPISWISMYLEATCAEHSSGLLMARGLRVFRVTRVIKLFRTYKVRMWVRRLKRLTGNTSIMQIMHLVVGLAFFNHIWTCISWVVQSADQRGFDLYQERMGLPEESSRLEQYSVMFMITLQTLFAIEPYVADTNLEAWFGSFTLAISIFISSTMLSKILEIWQMANEAQTQRDTRINTVMQFTARNGITTELRNEVLDYFEFRYSNPAADFAKRFMDDLPSEMQARVISQMFPGALEKSGLFKGASEMFISQLIVKMARRPMPTLPLQVIIAQGSYNSEMFLVKSGTVEVTTQDEDGDYRRIRSLGPGSTFGDLSMWMDSRQAASVTALDFCQLHVLTRSDLEEALTSFPEVAHVIASQALAHCLRTPGMAPHLEGLSVAASEKMGRRLAYNRVEFDPGMALYLDGEFADAAYVIRKGKVETELLDGRLEGLEDVRCVGFDALLTGWPYQETIRASGAVVAYRISAQDIIELFTNDFELLVEREEVAEKCYLEEKRWRMDLKWALMAEDLVADQRKEEGRRDESTPKDDSVTRRTAPRNVESEDDLAAKLRHTFQVPGVTARTASASTQDSGDASNHDPADPTPSDGGNLELYSGAAADASLHHRHHA